METEAHQWYFDGVIRHIISVISMICLEHLNRLTSNEDGNGKNRQWCWMYLYPLCTLLSITVRWTWHGNAPPTLPTANRPQNSSPNTVSEGLWSRRVYSSLLIVDHQIGEFAYFLRHKPVRKHKLGKLSSWSWTEVDLKTGGQIYLRMIFQYRQTYSRSTLFCHFPLYGLVQGNICRKPRFLPSNLGCKVSLKPIQWFRDV